jgi:FAD/FMN-containing dehydrogenase
MTTFPEAGNGTSPGVHGRSDARRCFGPGGHEPPDRRRAVVYAITRSHERRLGAPNTLTKLRRLKVRYDPDNIFNQNFPIPPATRGEPVEATRSANEPAA